MASPKDEHAKYTPFLRFRLGNSHRRRHKVASRSTPITKDIESCSTSSGDEDRRTGSEDRPYKIVQNIQPPSRTPEGPPLILYRNAFGMQQDPFDSLPMCANIPELGNALDFFLSIWCRTRPSAQSMNTFIPAFVSEVARRRSLLEGLVVYGQGYHEYIHQKQVQPSTAFLSRLGRLFEHLRRLLVSPEEGAIDEAILLIYILIGVGRVTGVQARETRMHSEGMGNLIEFRGGVDKLGLNGIVRAAAVAQQFFSSFTTSASPATSSPLHQNDLTHPTTVSFTYTSGLSAAETLEKACRLPYGLSTLALGGQLSQDLVEILLDFHSWLKAPRSIDGDTLMLATTHRAHGFLKTIFNNEGIRPELPRRRLSPLLRLEAAIFLVIVTVSAEIFYGTQIHVIAPQLASQMAELVSTRFWLSIDLPEACDDDRMLASKSVAWALMIIAEAVDPCQDGHAEDFMQTIFEMQCSDAGDPSVRACLRADEAEKAWEKFHEQVLREFLCPSFLIKEWRRCWLKHWKLSRRPATGLKTLHGASETPSETSSAA